MLGFANALWRLTVTRRSNDDQILRRIREESTALRTWSDQNLAVAMSTLRHGHPTESQIAAESLITCFSLMTEALRRTLGVELYDVQLRAGLALSRQSIAEMHTGEGKTLSAAVAACSFSLYGTGVHVMTVNAYLAERDYEILSPAFQLLGVSVGVLRSDASPEEKRDAYSCDVTYGPGYEYGFDYLRDQLNLVVRSRRRLGDSYRERLRGRGTPDNQTLQRGHAYAIIDEADSVMIDEATTPLILSGASPDSPSSTLYLSALQLTDQLERGRDYLFDARSRRIHLTNEGLGRTKEAAQANSMVGAQHPWTLYVENALRARLLFQRDVDYVIQDQQVMLVDQRTGRIFADRSWRDGLRQAVEAKEGVPITAENQSMARISRQRFLQLYKGMCGLTGTAKGVAREYRQVYQLPVVAVPLRTPSRRRVLPTRFFVDKTTKWSAIVDEIRAVHQTGQPVLVGTRTIQDSTLLAATLDQLGIPYRLLNGRQDADEADVVAEAGQIGAVTVATNMAGRGTDIKLASGVPELGGLHVMACEPHESARVDRQLIGRCARQGDPGSCRLFVSAEDELIADHGPLLAHRMERSGDPSGEIQVDLSAELARLQRRMERRAFAARRQLYARDHWLEEVVSKYAGKTSS